DWRERVSATVNSALRAVLLANLQCFPANCPYRTPMKAFLSLLASTVAVWTLIFFFTLYVPTITGNVSSSARPWNFLPWIPGIAIAFLSGTAGAFFNGLLEIWRTQPQQPEAAREQQPALPSALHFALRPLLGAFAGFILFLFFATGGLSLTY